MIPYVSVNFFSFPNEENSAVNLLANPPKINGIILVNFQSFIMNFTLNQFSNKLYFNFTDLNSLFTLKPQNLILIPAQLSINLSFESQKAFYFFNISFSKVTFTKKLTKPIIDYKKCHLNSLTNIEFPAGIYYSDTVFSSNVFFLYIMDTEGNLIEDFIEFNIELKIDPFCMKNSQENQYYIMNGYNGGVKRIVLKCDQTLKQGKIKVFIDGNLIGEQMEFKVISSKIDSKKSYLKSNFYAYLENETWISFSMRFFDVFGNEFDENKEIILKQTKIILENSRKDPRLRINFDGNDQSYKVNIYFSSFEIR